MKKVLYMILVFLSMACLLLTSACSNNLNEDLEEEIDKTIDREIETIKNDNEHENNEDYKAPDVYTEGVTEEARTISETIVSKETKLPSASEYAFPVNNTVFDFSILTEDEFPRGEWSVNQLIGKYGEPIDVWADYLEGYDIAFINLEFPNMYINFIFE